MLVLQPLSSSFLFCTFLCLPSCAHACLLTLSFSLSLSWCLFNVCTHTHTHTHTFHAHTHCLVFLDCWAQSVWGQACSNQVRPFQWGKLIFLSKSKPHAKYSESHLWNRLPTTLREWVRLTNSSPTLVEALYIWPWVSKLLIFAEGQCMWIVCMRVSLHTHSHSFHLMFSVSYFSAL